MSADILRFIQQPDFSCRCSGGKCCFYKIILLNLIFKVRILYYIRSVDKILLF